MLSKSIEELLCSALMHAGIRAQILRRRELSRGGPNDLPRRACKFSLLANDAKKFRAKIGIPNGVVQNGVARRRIGR